MTIHDLPHCVSFTVVAATVVLPVPHDIQRVSPIVNLKNPVGHLWHFSLLSIAICHPALQTKKVNKL